MGWDKAAEKRLAEVARCMEQPEAQNTQETAADIRAALDEIKRLADEEKAVDLYRKHFLRLTDWMGDRSGKVWRSGHDISARVIVRAESAEREAQQQRERADRLEAACGDYCHACGWRGIRGDEPCAFCRVATLEAALTQAHIALQGAWALLSPEDGERLGIKRLMLECERPECAALAAQPAQETKCARCNGTGEVSCDSVYGCGDPDDGEVSCPDCAGEGQR